MEGKDKNVTEPCPECGKPMEFTGLPDIAGDIDFRFFRCQEHGLKKVSTKKH